MTPEPPRAPADATVVERVIICEQDRQIGAFGIVLRAIDYVNLSVEAIIGDILFERPYVPRVPDCYAGMTDREVADIQDTDEYREWRMMRERTGAQFQRSLQAY